MEDLGRHVVGGAAESVHVLVILPAKAQVADLHIEIVVLFGVGSD